MLLPGLWLDAISASITSTPSRFRWNQRPGTRFFSSKVSSAYLGCTAQYSGALFKIFTLPVTSPWHISSTRDRRVSNN